MLKVQSGTAKEKAPVESCYSKMPTIKELADALTEKRPLFRFGFSRLQKICAFIFVLSLAVFIASALYARSASADYKAYGIFSVVVSEALLYLSWIVYAISIMIESFRETRTSANSLSKQVDDQIRREDVLIRRSLLVPARVLVERRDRLEMELRTLERRITSNKLLLLAGPPVLVLAQWFKGAVGNVAKQNVTALSPESLIGALALGIILGSVLLNSQTETLHRVSFALKAASEDDRSYHISFSEAKLTTNP